jgi:hypothetical protein
MRLQTWERYVPDVEDNRAKHARGESAFVVKIRPPTARVWLRFWLAVTESPKWSTVLAARKAELGDAAGTGVTLHLALMDEALAELLWLPCVGEITDFPDVGLPVPDGAALWALRDRLDSPDLYVDVLEAIVRRAHLEEGLVRPLASASGPQPSPVPASGPDGTVGSAARAD